MYCMECGAEIAAETKFCGKCGAGQAVVELAAMANSVNVDNSIREQNAELVKPTEKLPAMSKAGKASIFLKASIIFLKVSLIFSALILVFVYFLTKDDIKQARDKADGRAAQSSTVAAPAVQNPIQTSPAAASVNTAALASDLANRLGSERCVRCLFASQLFIGMLHNAKPGTNEANLYDVALVLSRVYGGLLKHLQNYEIYAKPVEAWVKSTDPHTIEDFLEKNCLSDEVTKLAKLGFNEN